MSELQESSQSVGKVRFNSIWLVPLLALIVAGWMVYQNWSSEGPEITLIASNAEGLEAGKTKVKARNVDIGTVTNIRLSGDYNTAIIQVRMNKDTENMLHQDAKFWVVKPRVGKEGISGLSTLLSGAYIDMEPGTHGEFKSEFQVLEQAPLSTAEDKGLRLMLDSTGSSKLDVGTVVHFRGYDVGYIEKVGFDTAVGAITYQVFIKAPYDALVSRGVEFWMTPGIALKSSAQGVEVRVDSLETLLSGGISFGLVHRQKANKEVEDLTKFHLYKSKEEAQNQFYNQFIDYVFLFGSDVSGLTAGAPVEFRGIRIGTVEQVPFTGLSMVELTSLSQAAIPVLARIEPQRLNNGDQDLTLKEWQDLFDKRIKSGFRASLKTRNFLTGAKSINIDSYPNALPVKAQKVAGIDVFPVTNAGFSNIEKKVTEILDKLAKAPVNESLQSIRNTMSNANDTLATVKDVSKNVDDLINQPGVKQLPDEVLGIMNQVSRILEAYQTNGEIGMPLKENLNALEKSLNELQPLLRQLRNNPNTLIFDKQAQPDIQPKAAQ
ncbi:intermembrane transport protein PqiB [Marinomonas pollencensis]|uniref:Paraquat-inducible protein B n=1 Tax=Marinomonas pollencensis TaxID=491954 RepID=A0A3E0DNF2_9GAMM|nr:intermembrane transport protein PqiB [Marinomonas pollencensis]REG84279.1 paraquat-inducible protein B [Marinomonas pollencensis]